MVLAAPARQRDDRPEEKGNSVFYGRLLDETRGKTRLIHGKRSGSR